MNKSKSVSLVIVDTDDNPLAKKAVEKSINLFPVDEVLIFSDQTSQWGNFSVIPIEKIKSLADYNYALLAMLPERLKTDFALVIQFDGFVVNPSSFTNFFYKFDYLGAPWPAGMIPGRGPTVGNGGFSLRSKRLVETLVSYHPAMKVGVPEDVTISRYLRAMLEEQDNISFAPVEVARHFSVEFEHNKDYLPFGFHGLHLLPQAYAEDYKFLIDNLPVRCLREGSYQLDNLRLGFAHLNSDAQLLFSDRVKRINETP